MLPAIAINKMGGMDALRSKIQSFFTDQGKVTMTHLEVTSKNESVFLDIKITFQNAADIVDLLSGSKSNNASSTAPDTIDQLLGVMQAKRAGLGVAVERNVDLRQLFPGGILSPNSSQVRDRHLEYVIHLPIKPHQSNAHKLADDGKTLEWKFPLAQALKEPLHLEVTAPIPIPHWLIALPILIFLFIVVVFFLKKSRKAKNAQP